MLIKNEEKFLGKANVYNKYRSSYPIELINYLYSQKGFSADSVIADIGSGTGKLSRLLLEKGSTVYCVEPNDDMRHAAENELGEAAGFKSFISVKATAENTELLEKSMDFITSAMSFHWFDKTAFKVECRRILKDNGRVVLIYDVQDKTEFFYNTIATFDKYRIDPQNPYVTGEMPSDIRDFFMDSICDEMSFKSDVLFTRETYIGRTLSKAYSPTEEANPDEYHALIRELGLLFDDNNINGISNMPQSTKCFIGKV